MTQAPLLTTNPPPRLRSLDAYRGFVMVCLAGNGFGIAETARKSFPDSDFWKFLHGQFDHVPWVGGGFWDLIQPSFMFMVGVSLPYSYARRQEAGDSYGWLFVHAILRSFVLILLGIFLSSASSKATEFTFMNVLTQIGLGYSFLFLLWNRGRMTQSIAVAAILVGYWAWFAMTPVSAEFDFKRVGLPDNWVYLTGFAAHWQKCANPAATFDLWFLNLFPRSEPFIANKGGYQTLNFIPSLATMIFGLMAGEFIRKSEDRRKTFLTLLASGIALFLSGWALGALGICPLVKRIWTPSWTLYSTGLTLMMLSTFYGVIDVAGWRGWAFPLVVAGMNSIALYVMSQLLKNWTAENLLRHFGQDLFKIFGTPYEPIVRACMVVGVFWLFVWWLYRQRIFFRI